MLTFAHSNPEAELSAHSTSAPVMAGRPRASLMTMFRSIQAAPSRSNTTAAPARESTPVAPNTATDPATAALLANAARSGTAVLANRDAASQVSPRRVNA